MSYAERKSTIEASHPIPHLEISQDCKEGLNRSFSSDAYKRIQWVTVSHTNNKLCCWSCLLLIAEKGVSNDTGYCDMINLTISSKKKSISQAHIHSMIQLNIFWKNCIDFHFDNQTQTAATQFDKEKVKENRKAMRRLKDKVHSLIKQGLPFRGYDERKLFK